MGIRGKRVRSDIQNLYEEPDLITNVDEILEKAAEKGYFDKNGNIELDKVAYDNDIIVSYEEMEQSQSGYFRCVEGKCFIGINKLHNKKRQRFTFAHELGHFFLHKGKNVAFADEVFFRIDNSSSLEYAANEFASRLLMPETKVTKLLNSGVSDLSNLADIFNVSISAMRYRVVSLGYIVTQNG